jgi:hypothetical protein
VKFALLLSQTLFEPPVVQTRIRARVVADPVTVHARDPPVAELGVLWKIVLQLLPPFRDNLIWTLPDIPVPDQVINWFELIAQISPPLGEVTATVRAEVPVPATAGDALPPLEVKLTFPEYVAADVGLKRIVTLWLAPAASENETPPPAQEPETTTQ